MAHLFFIDALPADERIVIDGSEAHHAINVLRMNSGEEVLVSDGKGNWARGNVGDITRKKLEVTVKERGFQNSAKPKLTILQEIGRAHV